MRSTHDTDCDVVIVGYGPVVAFSALLLADAGLRVAILERSREVVVLPRAVGLDGESLRAFQRIGWGEEVKSEGTDMFTWEGETVGPNENIRFRATLKKVDTDTISLKIEKRDGENWIEYAPEQTMKRKKEK